MHGIRWWYLDICLLKVQLKTTCKLINYGSELGRLLFQRFRYTCIFPPLYLFAVALARQSDQSKPSRWQKEPLKGATVSVMYNRPRKGGLKNELLSVLSKCLLLQLLRDRAHYLDQHAHFESFNLDCVITMSNQALENG